MRSFLLLYADDSSSGDAMPEMLANWVGDDSTQEVNAGAFGTPWVDRISSIPLAFNGAAGTMYNDHFNGHKAFRLRDDAAVFGPQNASPGISTTEQDYTFFFAMEPSEVVAPTKTMFDLDNLTDNTECTAYYWVSTEVLKSGLFWAEDTWTGAYIGTGAVGDIDVGVDTIFTIDCQGSDVKFYKNNVLFSTNAGYWAPRRINDRFAILGTYNNTTRLNNSHTAEIRIYPALTADQQTVVVDEMKTTYGIA